MLMLEGRRPRQTETMQHRTDKGRPQRIHAAAEPIVLYGSRARSDVVGERGDYIDTGMPKSPDQGREAFTGRKPRLRSLQARRIVNAYHALPLVDVRRQQEPMGSPNVHWEEINIYLHQGVTRA